MHFYLSLNRCYNRTFHKSHIQSFFVVFQKVFYSQHISHSLTSQIGLIGNILLLSASGQLILTFLEVNDSDSLQGRLSDLDHSDACMPKTDRPLPKPEYP